MKHAISYLQEATKSGTSDPYNELFLEIRSSYVFPSGLMKPHNPSVFPTSITDGFMIKTGMKPFKI